jgi:hypothetical protein
MIRKKSSFLALFSIASACIFFVIVMFLQRERHRVTLQFELRNPTQAPSQFAGDILLIFRLRSMNDMEHVWRARANLFSSATSNYSSFITNVEALSTRKIEYRIPGAKFNLELQPGAYVFVLREKGFGWIEIYQFDQDKEFIFDRLNSTDNF